MQRQLIVNADDFGQSHGVNRGVITTFEHGIVTSASMMVRWPAAVEAAAYAREHPDLSVGLHLDLGEWACRDGEWVQIYQVAREDDAVTVAAELERQLSRFSELLGRPPTHLDSHQHVHRGEPVRTLVYEAAARLGVPLRDMSDDVCYWGGFYGQTADGRPLPRYIGVTALVRRISTLSAGITEMGCHPAETDDLETMYLTERRREVRTLCDPRVKAALTTAEVALRSFHAVRNTGYPC